MNVDFGLGSPFPPALGDDWFVVRWEGYFQPPVTGTYQFAGLHDDSLKVWVDNQLVYNTGCCSDVNWTQATGKALTAGVRVPIKVELAEAYGASYLRLLVRTADGTTVPQIVPADWLHSTDSPPLPQGWTLSADLDGTGASYTDAKITDQTVVLTDATGAKHTWTKKSTGGYTPPDGEDGVLALDTEGRVTLTEGADVYVFRADGKLDTQSSALDSRKPAALQNLYDGTPSRLREIRDPVSQRSHRLFYNRPGDDCYGGVTPPAGMYFDPLPPPQMLCRIQYWDGTQTLLWYFEGRIYRVEDPGSRSPTTASSSEIREPAGRISVLHRADYRITDMDALTRAGRNAYLHAWPNDTEEDAALDVNHLGRAFYQLMHACGLSSLAEAGGMEPCGCDHLDPRDGWITR